MIVLKIENLISGYAEDIDILRGVNLKVRKSEIVTILGPNGAGKSTLLKTIYGLVKPKGGKVLFNNVDITGRETWEIRKMGISYVPQEQTYFPYLTVEENLIVCATILKEAGVNINENLEEVLSLLENLRKKKKEKTSSLSGGELKMLDIACGLIVRPKLVLVDEPSAGLAPSIAESIYKLIKRLADNGITILLVDQDVMRALEIADYAYLMEEGKIVLEGSAEEFRSSIMDIMKRALVGFEKGS